ncbi:MAG: hypothetical protein AB1896_07360 [Thermodesulfobacteriota bacterium]
MTILEFRRHDVVADIIEALQDEEDEVVEALVIGKKKSGGRFSFMTLTENIPELIGYLEAIKTDLAIEMLEQAEKDD